MKQIGLASLQYIQDYDERTVPRGGPTSTPPYAAIASWRQRLYPYIKSTQIFRCPSRKVGNGTTSRADPAVDGYPEMPVSYAMTNFFTATDGQLIAGYLEPSRKLIIVESPVNKVEWGHPNWKDSSCTLASADWTADWAGPNNTFKGHLGTLNYLFVDGHAKAYRPIQTATPFNMWGASNCVGGIPNVMARYNYSNPDRVITDAMTKVEALFN